MLALTFRLIACAPRAPPVCPLASRPPAPRAPRPPAPCALSVCIPPACAPRPSACLRPPCLRFAPLPECVSHVCPPVLRLHPARLPECTSRPVHLYPARLRRVRLTTVCHTPAHLCSACALRIQAPAHLHLVRLRRAPCPPASRPPASRAPCSPASPLPALCAPHTCTPRAFRLATASPLRFGLPARPVFWGKIVRVQTNVQTATFDLTAELTPQLRRLPAPLLNRCRGGE